MPTLCPSGTKKLRCRRDLWSFFTRQNRGPAGAVAIRRLNHVAN
jgi:hypothetical protein